MSESAKVLGRRWYIVVPILAGFALAAIFFVAGRGDPDYQASASMEVLPRYEFGVNTHRLGGITLTSIELIVDTAETRAEFEAADLPPTSP